jgi:hypothetical protein
MGRDYGRELAMALNVSPICSQFNHNMKERWTK